MGGKAEGMPGAEKGFASPYVIDCQKEFTDPQRHDGPGSLRVASVRSKLPGSRGSFPLKKE